MTRDGWQDFSFGTAYILAAAICCCAGQTGRRSGEGGGAWFLAAVILALLGFDALYRVDTFLTDFARVVSQREGWYGVRQEWQLLSLVLVGSAGLATSSLLGVRIEEAWSECSAAVSGVLLLLLLAVLRLVSFHDTDTLLNLRLVWFSTGRLLELAGLLMTFAGATRWLRLRSCREQLEDGSPERRKDPDPSFSRRL